MRRVLITGFGEMNFVTKVVSRLFVYRASASWGEEMATAAGGKLPFSRQ